MNIQMAVQTSREEPELGFGVRRCVAGEAIGDHAVAGMAHGAIHLSVLARGILPLIEDSGVAVSARLCFVVGPEGNLQRFVNRMAGDTSIERLPLEVRLVTLGTFGDVSVLLMVTTGAGHLSMFARLLLELLGGTAVTIGADVSHLGRIRREFRSVRIGMAVQALHLLGPVRLMMAHAALGHDLGIVVSQGVVGVKNLMTVTAIKSVIPAVIAQVHEMLGVALTALGDGQRFGNLVVQLCSALLSESRDDGQEQGGKDHPQHTSYFVPDLSGHFNPSEWLTCSELT